MIEQITWLQAQIIPLWAFLLALLTEPSQWSKKAMKFTQQYIPK